MDDELLNRIVSIIESPIDIVYFLRCNEYVKIGTTKGGLIRRIADLQVGNPYELNLEWFILGGNKVEGKIHKKLIKYWTRGEWHKIDKKEMIKLIKEI